MTSVGFGGLSSSREGGGEEGRGQEIYERIFISAKRHSGELKGKGEEEEDEELELVGEREEGTTNLGPTIAESSEERRRQREGRR